MSLAAEVAPPAVPRRGVVGGALRLLWIWAFGALMCLTPLTAVLVLGWLARMSRRESAVAVRRAGGVSRRAAIARLSGDLAAAPGWILGPGRTRAGRWLGGLRANAAEGLRAAAALLAATLPHGALMGMAWWGGWNNSFAKGYEQAATGGAVFVLGLALAAPVLAFLPMAFAHFAVERRIAALFEIRRIGGLIRAVPWRYLGLSLLFVAAALPLFATRGLPVFVENIVPGFADLPAEEQVKTAGALNLARAVYLFAALVVLRGLGARLYGRALARAGARRGWVSRRVFGPVIWAVLLAIWLTPPALVVFGQFLNHHWALWPLHPLFNLPWTPPAG